MSKRRTTYARAATIIGVVSLMMWLVVLGGCFGSVDDLFYDVAIRVSTSFLPRSDERLLLVECDAVGADDTLTDVVDRLRELDPIAIGISFPVAKSTQRLIGQTEMPVLFVESGSRPAFETGNRIRRHLAIHEGETSLEARLVRAVGSGIQLPTGPFGISFRGSQNSLPLIAANDVLSGKLVREIVADRVVLIGWTDETISPRLATATSGRGGMSLLEIRGHVVETLLAGDAIRTVGWPIQLLIVSLAAALGYLCGHTFRWRWALTIAVVAIVALGVVAGVLLCWQQLWIPCAPLFTALFLSVVIASLYGAQQENAALRRGRTSQLAGEWGLTARSERSWEDIAELLHQLIDVDKMVLLDVPIDSVHARVVYTKGVVESQIKERRRDRKRSPYQECVENGGPTRLDRHFLQPMAGEDQYMVPLIHEGEVVGFLMAGVPTDRLRKDNMLCRLSRSAPEIAALMAPMRSTASADQFPVSDSETHRPALAVYDLFGRMEMMNVNMATLFRKRGIDSDSARLFETLKALLDVDDREVNRLLSTVVLDGEFVACSVKTPVSDSRSILKITPIHKPATPFDIEAIGVALFPARGLSGAQASDANYAERIGQPALVNAARLWGQTQSTLPDTHNDDSMENGRPARAAKPRTIAAHQLRDGLSAIAGELEDGEWKLDIAGSMLLSGVAVESKLVSSTLNEILRLMVDDLPDKSTLSVSHVESEAHLQIELRATRRVESQNGKPADHKSQNPEDLKKLHALQDELQCSGSRLSINRTPFEIMALLTLPKILELAKPGIGATERSDTGDANPQEVS